ncbi:MAG: hypothetical protein FWG98_14560 [Candidatus Cloacimonetes bacterium]|nr:hypothetical protein [Candidatus Cloacimonadota bacterium]
MTRRLLRGEFRRRDLATTEGIMTQRLLRGEFKPAFPNLLSTNHCNI